MRVSVMRSCSMRTTVAFEDDVARLISDAQHRERKTLEQVVNEAVRRDCGEPAPDAPPYRVRAHHSRVRTGWPTSSRDDGLLAGGSRLRAFRRGVRWVNPLD